MKLKRLILSFALLLLASTCVAQTYTVTDLGTLGGTFTAACGANNKGLVDGFSNLSGDTLTHAFIWKNGKMTDLGTLGGLNSGAIFPPSNSGLVAGFAETSTLDPLAEAACGQPSPYACVGFIWRNGKMTALPTLGGYNARAHGINYWGQVVGASENTTLDRTCPVPQPQLKAVFWQNGSIYELPQLRGDPVGDAFAINDLGQAVGFTGDCTNYAHAVLWQNGTVINLGTLGGRMNNWAVGINNKAQVVGSSGLPSDKSYHAFLWQNGKMTDLGTLPGEDSSVADGINNSGQIVGAGYDKYGSPTRAFLWQNGVMTDLNTLIPPDSPLYLLEASGGINDLGQITGYAWHIESGEFHGFLATPVHPGESFSGMGRLNPTSRPRVTVPEKVRGLLKRQALPGRLQWGMARQQ